MEDDDGDERRTQLLRDRLRIAVVAAAETEAQKHGMSVSKPVIVALADLTFKYTELLAKDLELFAHHAGRKSVNMDDVILAAHRNEDLTTLLRSFSQDLIKHKEQNVDRKRKKVVASKNAS